MKIVYEYSHLGGHEILQVRFPAVLGEVYAVIEEVSGSCKHLCVRVRV